MARHEVTKEDLQAYRQRVLSKKDEDGNYRYPALARMMEKMPEDYDPDEAPSEVEESNA